MGRRLCRQLVLVTCLQEGVVTLELRGVVLVPVLGRSHAPVDQAATRYIKEPSKDTS
jgi:hypothetical protein